MTQVLSPEVAAAILNMLRGARALVYRDAESFSEAASVLEHVGQMLAGEVRSGLGWYEREVLGLANNAPGTSERELSELFRTVREARNDSVHSGDFIRHHALRLVELLLVLEEALSVNARYASDLMVRNPITAELWHNIATVRRTMLTYSFSYIPVRVDGEWKLISDRSIMAYLHGIGKDEHKRRLGGTVETAIKSHELCLDEAPIASPDVPVQELKERINHLPILIVDSHGNLHGILRAFDLL